jgi:hypothetical protein
LTSHDNWAHIYKPFLREKAYWKDGELVMAHEAASAMANDWMP